jgi:hypothetical protein
VLTIRQTHNLVVADEQATDKQAALMLFFSRITAQMLLMHNWIYMPQVTKKAYIFFLAK